MKPICPYPPPVELVGRQVLLVPPAAILAIDGSGKHDLRSAPESATQVRVVDNHAPYVVIEDGPRDGDRGYWRGLAPDYWGQHPDGHQVFIPGDGEVRDRLGRLGVTRQRWKALSPEQRRKVIQAGRAIRFLEFALTGYIKHGEVVRVGSGKVLDKIINLANQEKNLVRGLASEKKRAADSRAAQRLVAFLQPHLERVRDEGLTLRRKALSDPEWLADKASEVNAFGKKAGMNVVLTANDLAALSTQNERTVAQGIAARRYKVSADGLRFKRPRSRSKSPDINRENS